jgi:LAO/AO transport system kinase
MQLADRVRAGNVRAVARAITLVEEGTPAAAQLLQALFTETGKATVIGITGSPGAGKSSLVDRLIGVYRSAGRKVGVVAVDPSSAYSGGAILGDRIRMQRHSADTSVFIRSMATRGFLGGLSRAAGDAVDMLDAAGYDPIIVETVGVGQDEVDVIRLADVVAVVLVPGMGDDIQAIKAGILEIADLFVINKADHKGADRLEAELQFMLSLVGEQQGPRPAIFRSVAVRDEGIVELERGIAAWLAAVEEPRRRGRRRDRAQARFMGVLTDRLVERVRHEGARSGELEQLIEAIAERRLDPYSAAERILSRWEVR